MAAAVGRRRLWRAPKWATPKRASYLAASQRVSNRAFRAATNWRPSSPNVPLNVLAALLAGLVLPITYLTLLMNVEDSRREPYIARQSGSRGSLFRAVKARDE